MWSNSEYKGKEEFNEWTCERINKLVCLYRKYKCLWKKDESSYLNLEERHNAYKSICKNLSMRQVTIIQVLIKIQEIRKIYVRELKRIFHSQRNGCHYEPKFQCFWRLHQFLHPYLDHEETLQLHKALSNLNCDEESCVCLKNRKRRRKIFRKQLKRRERKPTIKFKGNSSFCSSSNWQLSDCDMSCNPCSTKTSKNLDVKNKSSNCLTNLTIETSNKTVSNLEIENCSQKTYILKNKEPVTVLQEQNTCGSVSKIECYSRSDISCLTVRKSCDQFDFFAKSVACQLRKMNINSALKVQKAIQEILKNSKTLVEESISPNEISPTFMFYLPEVNKDKN